MQFSFSCPQCQRPIEADSQRAGTMTLCEHCLVAFPIPEAMPPCSTTTPVRQQAVDSGWRLVRLGLGVVEAAMVAFLVAGLVAFAAVLVIGHGVFTGPL